MASDKMFSEFYRDIKEVLNVVNELRTDVAVVKNEVQDIKEAIRDMQEDIDKVERDARAAHEKLAQRDRGMVGGVVLIVISALIGFFFK